MSTQEKNLAKKEEKSLFQRLTTLFRSGPIVKRKVRAYKQPTASTAHDIFKKTLSKTYSTAMSSYGTYDRLCVDLDTSIAVPGPEGFSSLRDLIQKYPDGEKFIVYSYDHEKKGIVPAWAHHPRSSGVRETVKVTFDDGSYLICTPDHPCMMRDGSYRDAGELQPGDSMMPFYRKVFGGTAADGYEFQGYRNIYAMRTGIYKGWISEHKMIAEWAAGRNTTVSEEIHHRDLNAQNNLPDNLQIMEHDDHVTLHKQLGSHTKSEEFRQASAEWQRQAWFKDDGTRRENLREMNRREDIREKRRRFASSSNVSKRQEVKEKISSTTKKRFQDPEARAAASNRTAKLHEEGALTVSENFVQYWKGKTRPQEWKDARTGEQNHAFVSLDPDALQVAIELTGGRRDKVAEMLSTSPNTVLRRAKVIYGKDNWKDIVEAAGVKNHKVVSVEPHSTIEVGDLTVDGYENFATSTIIVHNSRYGDFQEMLYTPEISSALDIYSEEVAPSDDKGQILHIYSENRQIQRILEELFYDTLNVEFNLTPWVRNLCQYGDQFLFVDLSPEYGILNVLPMPVNEVEREEGFDPNDPLAVRFRWVTQGNSILENWQVVHFRLLGNDAFLPYGASVLEPARRIWRQLILIEDAMLVYRVIRSPERRVFYIDVGNVAPEEIPNYMEQAKSTLRSSQVIDRNTGRVDLRYNPLCNSLSTVIFLQDGRCITLGDLIREWEGGKQDQWVYSIDRESDKLVPGKVVWAGVTRKDAELIRVHLDDGTFVDVTPDHKMMLRDKTYREAEALQPGDKLMPLYKRWTSKEADGHKIDGYETVYDPFKQEYTLTHRLNVIAEKGFDSIVGKVVHHADFDKLNNNPDNLVPMTWGEHNKVHGDYCAERNRSESGRETSRRRMRKTWAEGKISAQTAVALWKDPKVRQKRVQALSLRYEVNVLRVHFERLFVSLAKGFSTTEPAFRNAVNSDEEVQTHLRTLNPEFSNGFNDKFTRSSLQRALKAMGFPNAFTGFKQHMVLGRVDLPSVVDFCLSKECAVGRKDVLAHFNICQRTLQELVAASGQSYSDFSAQFMQGTNRYKKSTSVGYKNHEVVFVERLSVREDTGCITVDKYHNFAVAGDAKCLPNLMKKTLNSGIFIKNSVDEDYFIPTRGGEASSKIDTLAGGVNTTAIEDVEYIQNKLFAALKIPKAYLGYDDSIGSKATLSQEDIRFSRTINRIQRVVLSELNKLAVVHLYANGFEGDDLLDFNLTLSNPSTIAQQQKLEIYRTKLEIAGSAPEGLVDRFWIRKNILNLTDDEIDRIEEGRIDDKVSDVAIEKITGAPSDEASGGGGGGGGGGGSLLGGLGGGEDAPDMEDGDEEGAEDPMAGGGGGGGPGGPPGDGGPEADVGDAPEDSEDSEAEDEGKQLFSSQLRLGTLLDEDDDDFTLPNIDSKKVPVSANARVRVKAEAQKMDQIARVKHNRSRRRTHGAEATVTPDLERMTSHKRPGDSLTDPYDTHRVQQTDPFSENAVVDQFIDREMTRQGRLSAEVKGLLNSLSGRIGTAKRSGVISEDVRLEDVLDEVDVEWEDEER